MRRNSQRVQGSSIHSILKGAGFLTGLTLAAPAFAASWPANDSAFAPLLAGAAIIGVCIVMKVLHDGWRHLRGQAASGRYRHWQLQNRHVRH